MQYFPEILCCEAQYHHGIGEKVKATYITFRSKYQGYNKVQTVEHYVRHPVTLFHFLNFNSGNLS
jgi:hypothetical protein